MVADSRLGAEAGWKRKTRVLRLDAILAPMPIPPQAGIQSPAPQPTPNPQPPLAVISRPQHPFPRRRESSATPLPPPNLQLPLAVIPANAGIQWACFSPTANPESCPALVESGGTVFRELELALARRTRFRRTPE